ncbi:MAG: dihydrofolate reductase family protein [Acidobacteriota bacterium]
MRTVTFGVGCSLDGFIARADHSVDWLHWSADVQALTTEFWKTIDTVVMGRKTYEVALRAGTSAYPGVRNIVFSRTMPPPPDRSVEVVADEAGPFMRALKAKRGSGICVMGGGELAHSLFEARLIDEVGLNIHPILLGSGIPLFLAQPRSVALDLVECRSIQGGCVYLLYRVRPTRPKRHRRPAS